MSEKNTLRIAPAVDRMQRASAWRMWHQGNEFYVSSRDFVRMGKFSFHRNFHWLFQLGTSVARLAKPLALDGDWLHALQLSFLVDSDALPPLIEIDKHARLVEVGSGEKLVLNVLLGRHAKVDFAIPPAVLGGQFAYTARLRSGVPLAVVQRIMPRDANDALLASDIREKLRVNLTVRRSDLEISGDAIWTQFSAETGNALVVVPVSDDVFVSPATPVPPN